MIFSPGAGFLDEAKTTMNAITPTFTPRKRIRKSFGRIPEVAPMPNLIDVQRSSYEGFLQMHINPDSRTKSGLTISPAAAGLSLSITSWKTRNMMLRNASSAG
jgi:DNA-directed RNA polymerase beta subunit